MTSSTNFDNLMAESEGNPAPVENNMDAILINPDICEQVTVQGGLTLSMTASTFEDVESFEKELMSCGGNIVPILDPYCKKETLVNGMYARTLFMPKGMIVTGYMHKQPYIDMMLRGDCTVTSYHINGEIEKAQRFKGFNQFDGIPCRKRVLVMHSDTLWQTVDRTTATKIDDVFNDVIYENSDDYRKGLK